MTMLRAFLFLCLIVMLPAQIMAASFAPGDDFCAGWKQPAQPLHFIGEQLFNYIDGAAELFLEFGFHDVEAHTYAQGKEELGLEIYHMESPVAAMGMYLMKCGKETPLWEIPARNSADRHQVTMVRGSYFILVNNFKGDQALEPAMKTLARDVVKDIPEEPSVLLFELLPREHVIAGSSRLFRGPCALQQIYYFGQGDVLQLKKTIFGTAQDYQESKGEKYTELIIPYPDKSRAGAAFGNLRDNLDACIRLTKKWDNGFTFKDYKDKFGIARLEGRTILITVNLQSEPGRR
jgi:hypothetical protein